MISFDSNILIYFIDGSDKWSEPAEKVLKKASTEGAVVSELIRQEVLTGVILQYPQIYNRSAALLESLVAVEYAQVDRKATNRALKLTRKYGRKVKGYDAIHLASAIENGATEFWTNDQQMVAAGVSEISVCSLQDSGII